MADVTYTYDRVGRKATVAQGTQDAVTLHYTAAGQLAAEQHTSGLLSGITVTNAYDGLLRRTHLTVLTNGGSVYQALYGYDAASRMLTVSDGTNNATYAYATNSSLVAEIAFKQNSTLRMTTTKQYDLLNRLTNISSTTASFTNSFAYLYNDANQRTKVTREDGSYWNYGYDDLGQVTSGKRYWADNTPVAGQQYEYDFDDIGNRKSTTQNSKPETRNSLYTVNLLNQYTSRTVPGYADVLGTAHSNATVTVNYERAARKGEYWHKELSLNNQGQALYAGVTNIAVLNDGANPDIVTTNTGKLFLPQTPEQFTYDDDGNLTGDGRWSYTWDGENRLIQMETKTGAVSAGTPKQKLEFAYDDQWRRIQKKVSDWNGSSYTATYTNRFSYDGWNLLAALNPVAPLQSYLWGKDLSGSLQGANGAGGMIMTKEQSSSGSFAVYDGNANVTGLAGSSDGSRIASYQYGPFGERLLEKDGTATSCSIGYATKIVDTETGLLFFGARYYSSMIGKWINNDPIGERGGRNLSSYVGNRPTYRVDRFGLSPNGISVALAKTMRYSCYCGWIDDNHIGFGQSIAEQIRAQISSGTVHLSLDLNASTDEVNETYTVNLPPNPDAAALTQTVINIMMAFSHSVETAQASTVVGGAFGSAFAIDDMPSNYLGALIGLGLYTRDQIKDICGELGVEDSLAMFNADNKPSDPNLSHTPVLWSDSDGDCGCLRVNPNANISDFGPVPDDALIYVKKKCPCSPLDPEKKKKADALFQGISSNPYPVSW